jgi:16S rRNA (adenine1518-N6/adenine1519-N6)-dimethyltransferase
MSFALEKNSQSSKPYPKKSLGQNFLTSIPARMAIVAAGEIAPHDTILEIGPGKGFLTRALLDTGAHVVALEKDRDLIPLLSETFSKEVAIGQLEVIEGDALEFNPTPYTLHPTRSNYKLIANIPYYITGAMARNPMVPNNHEPDRILRKTTKQQQDQWVSQPAFPVRPQPKPDRQEEWS